MGKSKLMKQLKKRYKKLGKKKSNGPIIALIIVGGIVLISVLGTIFGQGSSDSSDDDFDF